MSSNAIRKPCQSRSGAASRLTLAWYLWMSGACAPPGVGHQDAGPDGPCQGATTVVEVGQGGARLAALRAGDDLQIVEGSQGGIHVLVGFFLGGAPRDVSAVYRLTSDDEARTDVVAPLERALRPGLFEAQDGRTVRNPDLLVLNNDSPNPSLFADRRVRLRVELTEADGTGYCDERQVFLRAPAP